MTCRRLFLRLFIFTTLVTAGLWWHSLRTWSACSYAFRERTVNAYAFSGTIGMDLTSYVEYQYHFSTQSLETSRVQDDLLAKYPPTGKFRLETQPQNDPTGHHTIFLILEFPVWLPWLLTTAGGYFLMRRMEKGSAGAREKMLAAEQASTGS